VKSGNLGEFLGDAWVVIGVYGGKNAFWTLLHHRKTAKKR
jgi:hypothetical protein